MINNDSIVTAYDEHLTLVEWLQKIEKLLANGGLKSTALNDKGNATFSLTLTFNDDTTITSPDMTLTSVNEALTALNKAVIDLGKYKGFNITFPISEMEGVKMLGRNIDVSNNIFPADFNGQITAEQKDAVYTLILKAISYGYVIDAQSNDTGALLPLIYCDITNDFIFVAFGSSEITQNVGQSYAIKLENNNLNVIYGEV